MATDRGVSLPTTCAGAFREHEEGDDGADACPNAAEHVYVTVLPGPDGAPMPVLVGSCRWHLADVRLWLQVQSLGDPIDVYPVRGFPTGLLEGSGLDWHVLRAS